MKKIVSALAAGLILVAGQAAAQGAGASTRVADRIGAPVGEASGLAALDTGMTIISLIGLAGSIAAISALTDDDSESD